MDTMIRTPEITPEAPLELETQPTSSTWKIAATVVAIVALGTGIGAGIALTPSGSSDPAPVVGIAPGAETDPAVVTTLPPVEPTPSSSPAPAGNAPVAVPSTVAPAPAPAASAPMVTPTTRYGDGPTPK